MWDIALYFSFFSPYSHTLFLRVLLVRLAFLESAAEGETVTTKDCRKLAAALSAGFQTATTTGQAHGVRLAANSIVLVLEKDNSKFDRNKFEKALGFSLAIIEHQPGRTHIPSNAGKETR